MAKTKFLDYTGLAKLVEKIKNTYVNKNEQYEANLKWGGGNFADSFSPIDGAMVPEFGANRFAFANPNGITIEYSNDGGNTWFDYGASDAVKTTLTLNGDGSVNLIIGKDGSSIPTNDMLRITFDTSSKTGINCYSVLNKFVINISTEGMKFCYCTIQKALQKTPTVFSDVIVKVPIGGWTGYNIINTPSIRTYGWDEENHYGRIRFIFGSDDSTTTNARLKILSIFAFGGVGWNTPSNMAKNGHLYNYNYKQDAIFPANVTATNFIGTLQGNANSASKLGTATVGGATRPMYLSGGTPTECTYSLNADVPKEAVFTDTIYTLSQNVNNHAKISLTSVNGSDNITIDNVENADTASKLSSSAGDVNTPVYFSDGKPNVIDYTIETSVPSGAVFTDKSVEQTIYNIHGIPDNYQRPLLIGTSIIEDGTVNPITGNTLVSEKITASIRSGTITATGGFIGEATSASKLSVDGGNTSTNDVLVLGNYANKIFTPSGIVLKITDTDIENEIKNAIVWPTA